jgi:hypothetical protein
MSTQNLTIFQLNTHTHTSFANLALTGTLSLAGVSTLKNTNITGTLEASSCITTKGTGFLNAFIATNHNKSISLVVTEDNEKSISSEGVQVISIID